MDLEWQRKQAKALVRAVRAGEAEAVARAERALGPRARRRFVLADAQHVIAVEQGARSWRGLRERASGSESRARPAPSLAGGAATPGARGSEPQTPPELVETGHIYVEGRPVVVRIRRRGPWVAIDDDGAAVALAGRPPGWLAVAERVVEEAALNVNRRGAVFVGRVHERRDVGELVARVAATSRALYGALLELAAGELGRASG